MAPSKVRPGCQTNAWRIDANDFNNVLTVLHKIHHYGYEGFETGFRNVQSQFKSVSSARKAIEAKMLEFIGCHIFLLKYDQATSIAPAELCDTVIAGSTKLGAKRLILSGASVQKDKAALARKAAALNEAGNRCKKAGIQLCYHNHDLEFVDSAWEIEEILRSTDGELVHLLMDAGHAWRAKADVAAFFTRHHQRIDGMHIRDFRSGEQVPLGQGTLDLHPLLAAINAAQWNGWIINEEERLNDIKPGDSAIEPARRHLTRIFGV